MANNTQPSLLSGERIVWQGKPDTGFVFRPIELFLIPFSLFWAGFALFWNIDVWGGDGALSFKLFGLPFLIIGIYITVGRFVVDSYLRKRLIYTVTNKRVIISKSGEADTTSLDITRLPSLEFDEKSDGYGTIRFGSSSNWFDGSNFGIWQPTLDKTPQLIRVPSVRSVYELIQKQAHAA